MSTADDTPEDIASEIARFGRWINDEIDGRIRRIGALARGPPSYRPSSADRALLRSLGISADERAYEAGTMPARSRERVLGVGMLGARLERLCEEIEALESGGRRLAASEYRELLDAACSGADAGSILTGSIDAVRTELDALRELRPGDLIPSERCVSMLERIDPRFFAYHTKGWPAADLGGC